MGQKRVHRRRWAWLARSAAPLLSAWLVISPTHIAPVVARGKRLSSTGRPLTTTTLAIDVTSEDWPARLIAGQRARPLDKIAELTAVEPDLLAAFGCRGRSAEISWRQPMSRRGAVRHMGTLVCSGVRHMSFRRRT
jgi:hypothetical protein